MNRNVLKIIAVVSMLVDHIGVYLFPEIFWLRYIGRLAFPIFAFFIAEGLRYTRSRKRYVLMLFLFACISQIPYGFLVGFYNFNILFTFLLSIFAVFLIESFKKHETLNLIGLIVLTMFLIFTDIFNIIDYGFFGVSLVLVFYFVKDRKLSLVLGGAVLTLLSFKNFAVSLGDSYYFNQLFSLVSILLLFTYNNKKGRIDLKYLFYVFYPAHLVIILIVKLFVL